MKKDAVLGYGATVVDCEPTKRAETQAQIMGREGQVAIGSYNHPHVMAGQGTLALELISQAHSDPRTDATCNPKLTSVHFNLT